MVTQLKEIVIILSEFIIYHLMNDDRERERGRIEMPSASRVICYYILYRKNSYPDSHR